MAKEKVEEQVIKAEEVKEKKAGNKNSWKIAAVVLGVAVVVMLVLFLNGGITGGITGKAISEKDAADKLISYLSTRAQGEITFVSSEDIGNLYMVTVSYMGEEIPVYVTKDGDYFVQGVIPMSEETSSPNAETQEVPKSDKPKVEAFIFSYCPYGLQFEKALLPVYDLLKSKADINIVAIGAMHGEYEKQESLRQISVEQLYGKDKLFSYLKEFNSNTNVGSCNGEDSCLNKYLPAIYSKLGIDKSKVENYMKTSAEKIYEEQGAKASELGISGSPTFVINGVEVQVARTADAVKIAVCSAFNTQPSECSQSLSTASPSPGFGASTASGSASSTAGCAI